MENIGRGFREDKVIKDNMLLQFTPKRFCPNILFANCVDKVYNVKRQRHRANPNKKCNRYVLSALLT